ncbi:MULTISPECIES: HAD family hydrolase [Uliginosibacterium]|jgi:2-haloacid dehalogenase|uniref:HAD family phosphatase n=1 Tax=Uliginosibacterium aquaticum TaxID=2731212 RepID=A0ABX2IH35_9RHOO|nr:MULTISPECIES: HAD family phosphatase [Uliginosibacterium]MDO6385088.1 HAD family phosphatase [Uliginosibacterium sp. 31-12]NSL55198.1 HAD family phosphatase [Uliginosibacterium aquaticum]PLK48765.1 HAD family hydrolase [Uliginosibacterium sp. TH139]
MTRIDTVVFDLGNVLIPWEPRWLFRKLLQDEAEIERFLQDVDFNRWNAIHDAGQPFAVGIESHGAQFPHYRHLLQAYFDRWEESVAPAFEESVRLLRELKTAGLRVLALTNFSAETFPRARRLYDFLDEFEGIVVSGDEGLIKPDAAIYKLLFERYSVKPEQAVFIDDSVANVATARQLGMQAIHFTEPGLLRQHLRELSLPV